MKTSFFKLLGAKIMRRKKKQQRLIAAAIALANNAANEARGLLLLQSAGLIKLKKNFDSASGNTNDIVSNTKKFKFKLIDDTTGPRIIKSVDAVLIGNTIALAGNLNVLKDSLYHEKIDQSTKNNNNVLATAKKNKNNAAYKKLGKLYHNKQIQKWIAKKYSGTKVEVNKPVSYLTD
ncbi:ABC transporter substrate-binding protein [Lactobacillus delbrueckii subsp. lactis DSM 20072]|nr:ABC superfamily ATP binding cassette transporter, binding protein [Lactobacillus delbrueckii subsp. lactis DSM 20072]KRK65810.1 abc superfamily atp binding cassette transporter, binding protein [Lactobacillus delbrueckii subsp. lactis DSM 20072]OOV10630.1 ABC transporter substrate-binding protein [Lactobacillus delbrueckii subsp. lactis DSM 20072]